MTKCCFVSLKNWVNFAGPSSCAPPRPRATSFGQKNGKNENKQSIQSHRSNLSDLWSSARLVATPPPAPPWPTFHPHRRRSLVASLIWSLYRHSCGCSSCVCCCAALSEYYIHLLFLIYLFLKLSDLFLRLCWSVSNLISCLYWFGLIRDNCLTFDLYLCFIYCKYVCFFLFNLFCRWKGFVSGSSRKEGHYAIFGGEIFFPATGMCVAHW